LTKRLFLICFASVVLRVPIQASAQFTDPQTYDNTPVGTNQVELGYAHVRANTSIDTSLIITGARFDLNQGTINYTRYFGLLRRLTWVEASVPFAGLGGSIAGTMIQGSSTGAGDSSYQLAMLLKGGPALNVTQFEHYTPTTTLGVSLAITAPTGSYDPKKILNLGSDRWSFKPEIALSHPFGPEQKWELDTYANAYFYTDNISYHGAEILGQQPLAGFEGHISYSFREWLWASLDTRYSFLATTFLNGVTQDNAQQNFILGSEINISLDPHNSLVFEFAKALVHENGPDLVGFSVRYDFAWSKVHK
jgi:hypothetical protein